MTRCVGMIISVADVRPDLVNSDATFGELAWIWGTGMPPMPGPGRVACGFPAASSLPGVGLSVGFRPFTRAVDQARGLVLVSSMAKPSALQAGAGTPSRTMTGKTRSVFFSYSEAPSETMP